MRIGFLGGSYTSRSNVIADEECINFFMETTESQGAIAPKKAYGGSAAAPVGGMYGTPGLSAHATLGGVPNGQCWTGTRHFAVGGGQLVELASDGTSTVRASVETDNNPASIVFSSIQLLIVSAGHAYCYTLADNTIVEVTSQLAGVPVRVDFSDTYFIVCFQNSNKFQISALLDGTTWPGTQVNAVSVFPENISSIICNHRELWVFGLMHAQPYQDTGSVEVFDVIPGPLIENGNIAAFAPCRIDNSIFWVDQDERGACTCRRSNGYTPTRISTHAVETDLATYSNISSLVSYSYQDGGHLFWVLYIPGSQWSWVFDVTENLWHKRAFWNNGNFEAHHSWNHVYAFGMHLVGDWASGNIYQMSTANLTDNGTQIRRVRRTPTVSNEMDWIYFRQIVLDFAVGLGPQPPLIDGNNAPRPPQAIVRWSDNRGFTWSNEHLVNCGFAGQYTTRAIVRRLGRSRYRVFELVVTDPIAWVIVDAYVETA